MRLYLVRHAHAGDRSAWEGDDRLRPLSGRGVRQAEAIRDELLPPRSVARLVSSPYLRCVDTLRPLAEAVALPLDSDPRLAEGSHRDGIWELAEELRRGGRDTVVCSHGDVIPELLGLLRDAGARFLDPLTWPKASIWVIATQHGTWTEARYLSPRG